MTPVALAHAADRLRARGARDVSVLPLQMKKGRLAMRLTVLCDIAHMDTLAALVLKETTTIGLRRRAVVRDVLPRRIDVIRVRGGSVRVKVAVRPGGIESVEPEFEDVARIAIETGRPYVVVRSEAIAAFRKP